MRDKGRVRNYHKTMEYKDRLEAKEPTAKWDPGTEKGHRWYK